MKYETRVWRPFQRDAYHWAWYEEKLSGIIKELGREIRYCHQRICRGYCDHDIFSIYDWFLGIMPSMLEEFRDNLHGCPDAPGLVSHRVFLDDADKDTESMKAWTAVLDKIIFLLKEAGENTCSRTNPYEEAFHNASREFEEKYGEWGEKLLTPKEQDDMKNNRGHGKEIVIVDDDGDKYTFEEFDELAGETCELSQKDEKLLEIIRASQDEPESDKWRMCSPDAV